MEKVKEIASQSRFEALFPNAISPHTGLYFSSARVLISKINKINALRVKAAVTV